MRFDTHLTAPLGSVAEQARRLRAMGLDGVYTFENAHDTFFPLVEAALATDLEVYPNVAIAFPRSPMHLAVQAWDLQTITDGRFALGLGTQVKAHVERRYSATWDKPVGRMRELVEAIRAVFRCWQDGEKLDFRGDHYTLTLMPPTFSPGALECGPPPIWVGALGPQMTRMVAGTADGLLVHPFMTEAYAREVMQPVIRDGLAKRGRTDDDLMVGIDAIVCTGRDDTEREAADTGTRWLLAFYGSTPAYKPVLDHLGYGDLQPELNQLSKQGRWDEMAALVDEPLLDHIALRGTPKEVAGALRDRYAGVADRIGFYLPYTHDDELIGEVMDHVRAEG
jgi:probable F420-dependent oxidoreductase